jgi:hypothetical protein
MLFAFDFHPFLGLRLRTVQQMIALVPLLLVALASVARADDIYIMSKTGQCLFSGTRLCGGLLAFRAHALHL